MGKSNSSYRRDLGDHPTPQIARESAKESKHNMSSLAVRFVVRMRKQAVSAQGETTLGFGVPDGKCLKQSSLNEEV